MTPTDKPKRRTMQGGLDAIHAAGGHVYDGMTDAQAREAMGREPLPLDTPTDTPPTAISDAARDAAQAVWDRGKAIGWANGVAFVEQVAPFFHQAITTATADKAAEVERLQGALDALEESEARRHIAETVPLRLEIERLKAALLLMVADVAVRLGDQSPLVARLREIRRMAEAEKENSDATART